MKDEDRKLLEDDGWEVDCESPFEISREDGSRATLAGAEYVLEYLRLTDRLSNESKRVCMECGAPATNTYGNLCDEHEHLIF